MHQGEYVAFSVSDDSLSTTPLALSLRDADGTARTLASNERLLIDTMTVTAADTGAPVQLKDGSNLIASLDSGSDFRGGPEGFACAAGVVPKISAAADVQVDVAGTGRIILDGSVDGIHRPSYREALPGRS